MAKRQHQVHTLVVTVGRKEGDGLPEGAHGAGILCFASGISEDEAVRETVAVMKTAGLAPIEVTAHGSVEERRAAGEEIGQEETALMQRALDENAVIVVEVVPDFEG